tara:strand:+ start:372 stop:623 length:252 start_codon:yes stop_codon:yes gene_type:complete
MRYQTPRYAQDSAEKNKKEQREREKNMTPFTLGQAVIRGRSVEREEEVDGKTYTYEYTEHDAPIAPETFDRMTKGKYKRPRRT